MLQEAYRKDFLSKTRVFMWQKTFKDGRKDVDDEQCVRRP